MCGEKGNSVYRHRSVVGSPPRVRGKVLMLEAAQEPIGITPACAGKREAAKAGISLSEDHPRVCGEKSKIWGRAFGPVGSPPRVRGKGLPAVWNCTGHRITPACAGKSFPRRARHGCRWDHPRVCGEKHLNAVVKCHQIGSPPRVRGKGSAPNPERGA